MKLKYAHLKILPSFASVKNAWLRQTSREKSEVFSKNLLDSRVKSDSSIIISWKATWLSNSCRKIREQNSQ